MKDFRKMKFTKEHEWVAADGEMATIGITDYAAGALGDIVSLELPKVGNSYKQGQGMAIVDSMKASSDVYAPVSCQVMEVNTALPNSPQLINEDAYGKGWLAKAKLTNPSELEGLMSKEEYDKFVEEAKAKGGH